MTHSQRAISGAAFLTLLTIALMMGANHVAARFAFDSGVDVLTAIAFRSVLTAFVIALIVWQQRVPLMLTRQQQRHLPVIGLLIAVQSFCLYSAVARLPVVLALLAFNTYPISTALWARLLYKQRPQREVLLVIPFILFGLALALDVLGAASGLSASAHWLDIGSGVAFAFAASLTFGLCLVITENETRGLDGRLRTLSTLGIVGLLAVAAALSGDGFQLPNASPGWWGVDVADVFVWHGVHGDVHGIAQTRCRGQLCHHECGARLCAVVGVGIVGPDHRPYASGRRITGGGIRYVAGAAQGVKGSERVVLIRLSAPKT